MAGLLSRKEDVIDDSNENGPRTFPLIYLFSEYSVLYHCNGINSKFRLIHTKR